MEGLLENLPDLEHPFSIYLMTKATKMFIVSTNDVSKSPLGFMLHMDFAFFNVESIRGLNRILWIYTLLFHTHLDSQKEASVHHLTL